jgi:predicted lipid-binding transport protein (Tim44 family)
MQEVWMTTRRDMKAALLCFLFVCASNVSQAQARSAAAVGFSYTSASEHRAIPEARDRVCEPDRKLGAAAGAFAGLLAGALTGSAYRLFYVDANYGTISFPTFLLVGAAAGTVFGIVKPPVICRSA